MANEAKKKNENRFDAVKYMRKVRKQILAETSKMDFDELKKYLSQKLEDTPRSIE